MCAFSCAGVKTLNKLFQYVIRRTTVDIAESIIDTKNKQAILSCDVKLKIASFINEFPVER